MPESRSIAIMGAGYVGLVTGTYFADKGHSVTCTTIDETQMEAINKGQAHFFEPGLTFPGVEQSHHG